MGPGLMWLRMPHSNLSQMPPAVRQRFLNPGLLELTPIFHRGLEQSMGYQSLTQDDDLRGSTERTQRRILVETTIANNKKSMGIAYLLLFVFGGLGIHNFYVGKTGLGAAQVLGVLLDRKSTRLNSSH